MNTVGHLTDGNRIDCKCFSCEKQASHIITMAGNDGRKPGDAPLITDLDVFGGPEIRPACPDCVEMFGNDPALFERIVSTRSIRDTYNRLTMPVEQIAEMIDNAADPELRNDGLMSQVGS